MGIKPRGSSQTGSQRKKRRPSSNTNCFGTGSANRSGSQAKLGSPSKSKSLLGGIAKKDDGSTRRDGKSAGSRSKHTKGVLQPSTTTAAIGATTTATSTSISTKSMAAPSSLATAIVPASARPRSSDNDAEVLSMRMTSGGRRVYSDASGERPDASREGTGSGGASEAGVKLVSKSTRVILTEETGSGELYPGHGKLDDDIEGRRLYDGKGTAALDSDARTTLASRTLQGATQNATKTLLGVGDVAPASEIAGRSCTPGRDATSNDLRGSNGAPSDHPRSPPDETCAKRSGVDKSTAKRSVNAARESRAFLDIPMRTTDPDEDRPSASPFKHSARSGSSGKESGREGHGDQSKKRKRAAPISLPSRSTRPPGPTRKPRKFKDPASHASSQVEEEDNNEDDDLDAGTFDAVTKILDTRSQSQRFVDEQIEIERTIQRHRRKREKRTDRHPASTSSSASSSRTEVEVEHRAINPHGSDGMPMPAPTQMRRIAPQSSQVRLPSQVMASQPLARVDDSDHGENAEISSQWPETALEPANQRVVQRATSSSSSRRTAVDSELGGRSDPGKVAPDPDARAREPPRSEKDSQQARQRLDAREVGHLSQVTPLNQDPAADQDQPGGFAQLRPITNINDFTFDRPKRKTIQLWDKNIATRRNRRKDDYLLREEEAKYAQRNLQRLVIILVTRLRNGADNSHDPLKKFLRKDYFEHAWADLLGPIKGIAKAAEGPAWCDALREEYKQFPDSVDFNGISLEKDPDTTNRDDERCNVCCRDQKKYCSLYDLVWTGRYDEVTLAPKGDPEDESRVWTFGSKCFKRAMHSHALWHLPYKTMIRIAKKYFSSLNRMSPELRKEVSRDVVRVDEIVNILEENGAANMIMKALYLSRAMVRKRRIRDIMAYRRRAP